MNLTIAINNEEVVALLVERGQLLDAAVLEAVGSLGTQLWERVRSKIEPVVRTAIGKELFDSILLQAAAFVDRVCGTSVGIDDEGQPSYVVAYVREFGHKAYTVYPLRTQLGGFTGEDIGAGIKSPFSDREGPAWAGSYLPKSLAWVGEGGGMVFASHVHIPASGGNSYLRSSLAEMELQIKDEIVAAIAGVLAA